MKRISDWLFLVKHYFPDVSDEDIKAIHLAADKQLQADQKEHDEEMAKLKEESEARRELINRLTTRCEELREEMGELFSELIEPCFEHSSGGIFTKRECPLCILALRKKYLGE